MQARVDIVTFDELSWPPVVLNVQESTSGIGPASGQLERSEPSTTIDVPTVLQSYAWAYQCGLLQSPRIPVVGESLAMPRFFVVDEKASINT